jgi:hypothetical protein
MAEYPEFKKIDKFHEQTIYESYFEALNNAIFAVQ